MTGPGWEGAGQSSWEVADVVVRTLIRDDPPFRVPTSPWVSRYVARKLADPDGETVQAMARTWIGAAP